MKSFKVTCPACSTEFEPMEAQNQYITKEVETALAERKEQLVKQQKELKVREDAIKKSEDVISERVEQALKIKEAEIEKKAEREVAQKAEIKFRDLQGQLAEKDAALRQSNDEQLKLMKIVREASERQQRLDLEVEQKVSAQIEIVQSDAMKRADDQYKLKMAEKDKKIKDIETQLEVARRTVEQGSQQTQGEVAQVEFETLLPMQFPLDKFEPVPTGAEGADIVQTVYNAAARKCGIILWEIKNTKSFGGDWIQKLKRDQQRINADAAILVTRTLPKDVQSAELVDGVLIVSYELAMAMAKIVRKSLEDISYSQLALQGQDEKTQLVYNYLTGNQFRLKMKSIVSAFLSMKSGLDTEKRAFIRIWKAREKLLDQVIDSATSMYGDIEGIAGNVVPQIEELQLPSPELPCEDEIWEGEEHETA